MKNFSVIKLLKNVTTIAILFVFMHMSAMCIYNYELYYYYYYEGGYCDGYSKNRTEELAAETSHHFNRKVLLNNNLPIYNTKL